jgi:hypothetical protein
MCAKLAVSSSFHWLWFVEKCLNCAKSLFNRVIMRLIWTSLLSPSLACLATILVARLPASSLAGLQHLDTRGLHPSKNLMPIMQNKEGKEKDVETTEAEASTTEISKENLVLNGKFRIQKAHDAQKTMGGRASPCSKKNEG